MSAEDELGILRTLSLYCHVADDKALDRLLEVFTPDAVLEPPTPRRLTGVDDIRWYWSEYTPKAAIPVTCHLSLDTVIDLDPDGRTARVRSKGMGFRADMGYVLTEYDDVVEKTPAGWRIKHRRITRKTKFSTDRDDALDREVRS